MAKAAPDVFAAAASVHPYRPDAVEALERAVEGGAVAVKWLTNGMGMVNPHADSAWILSFAEWLVFYWQQVRPVLTPIKRSRWMVNRRSG